MINYIFTTKRYDEEAQRYSASNEVQKIREKMEKTPEYEPDRFDSFPGNYHKVYFNNNFRLIFSRKEERINGEDVRIYVALRVLKKGDNECKKFESTRTSISERDTIAGKLALDWNYYIQMVEEDLIKPVEEIKKPNLTEAETNFVTAQFTINHELFDITVYETKNWINDVQKEGFNDYSNAASTILSYIKKNLYSGNGWYVIEFKKIAILAYHINDDWVLDRILDLKKDHDYSDYLKDSSGKETAPPKDFQRGYPYTYLQDEDEWRLMEKDKKSNMVLSQQQVDIVSGDIQFPLFLTGRAGSGKSTMLQYLFAEIILRYLNTMILYEDGLKPPVYLSYSSNLITDAKNLCKTLFEKNSVYQDLMRDDGISYKEDISPLMQDMFFVFSDLLRLCIDNNKEGESFKLFPIDKYISFPIFNILWNKKFGKIRDAAKKYGPTISWHVIRTYIKGWNSNKFMTPEEYDAVGEKNQTVKSDTFKLIYCEVWEKWYSQIEGVWDDQDIVRYCLEHNLVDEHYSAVFCDESQDFTRIEIDFILKLSSFSNRRLLHTNEITKLPFVFAGDEFQTLNPTGFSWASLGSYFTECLCNSTGLEQIPIPDPIELRENFRSTRQVVKLANRVQLLRASRFGEFSKPQTPHFSEDGNSVYCVSPSNKFIFDKLKEKHVILIVPAADGESIEEYISKTPLKDQIEFENGVPQDITILNPTQAKGLEYPNVAVYGFKCDGHNSPLKLANLLEWFSKPTKDVISDIELKYQISNAYVAVTRAGSNLYIIDDFNDGSFWAFAFNQDDPEIEAHIKQLQERMFSQLSISQQEHWLTCKKKSEDEDLTQLSKEERLMRNLGLIDNMPEGVDITDENLSYLRSEEHKNDLENRAEALHDPKLMRQAACIHKSAGNKKDEARCKAKAFNFEEDYLQAARWFEIAESYDLAVENYWIELNLHQEKSIISQIAQLKDHSQNVKVRICVMCANPTVRNLKLAIDDTLIALEQNRLEHATLGAWQFVLNYILQNIQAKKNDGIRDIPVIVDSCHKLLKFDIVLDVLRLASLAFHIGAHNNAITLWEEIDKTNRPAEYFHAKLKTLKYPDTVEYYEGTGDEDWKEQLIQEYRKKPNSSLVDSQKRVIASVIKSIGTHDEYMKFLPFLLRIAYNIETSQTELEFANKFECELNNSVLNALIEARFTDLSNWQRPKEKFVSPDAVLLFDAIEVIKRMREEDFVDYLNRSLKAMKVIDFGKRYNVFSRKVTSKLVFLELGKVFESRDSFIDSIRYYEWAMNQSDDESFKRAIGIRWIVCKERQAKYEKDDSPKKSIYTKEALDRRKDIGISYDEKLPETSALTYADWEELFAYYITVSNEVVETEEKKTEKKKNIKVESEPTKEIISNDRSKLKKQELRYNDYSVVFFPGKGDVVIKDTENEFQIRIKDGNFPENGDFILKDSRIYVADEEAPTPFVFVKTDETITIKVYESEKFTGMAINIELPK